MSARLTSSGRWPPRPPQNRGVTSPERAVTRRPCPNRRTNVGRTAAFGYDPVQLHHWKKTSAFAPGDKTWARGHGGAVDIPLSRVGSCLPRQLMVTRGRAAGSEQATALVF